MQPILAKVKNLRQFTADDTPYTVEFYQREYKWEKDQVIELINDLHQEFLSESDHVPGARSSQPADRGHYFLGSIIVSDEERAIVDGQQRLTSLTLLLICLHHLLVESTAPSEELEELKVTIRQFVRFKPIGSTKYVYRLNVKNRTRCIDDLLRHQGHNVVGHDESIMNIVSRYDDIRGHLSNTLDKTDTALFAEWLLNCTYIVEITTKTQADAYAVFETMNDRGLRLTPTEMLKGFLLSRVPDKDQQSDANGQWRGIVESLQQLSSSADHVEKLMQMR